MDKRHLHYRRATGEDLPALQELGIAAYGQFKAELTTAHWAQLEANLSSAAVYRSLLERSESFICTHQGDTVGMAFMLPSGNPSDIYPADWSYIRFVGVHPGYSGRGIGRHLTMQCIEAARQKGEKIIGLHTSEMMHAARHIYEGLGFSKIKELSPRFGKRYWLYQLLLHGPH